MRIFIRISGGQLDGKLLAADFPEWDLDDETTHKTIVIATGADTELLTAMPTSNPADRAIAWAAFESGLFDGRGSAFQTFSGPGNFTGNYKVEEFTIDPLHFVVINCVAEVE
jgi:hypothetical protein